MKGWDPLRIAGAAGKYMLMKAASIQWNTPIKNLIASEGIITNKVENIKIGYGDVASQAVNIKVPKNLKLKTLGKIGKDISYFIPLVMGVYFIASFVSST